MTNDALLVVKCLFETIWSIFTSWHIPGTNVSPAAFFLFLITASVGLSFVYRLFGLNPSLDSSTINKVAATFEDKTSK